MRYIIERGRETCLAPSASEIISHTQKTLTISLVRLCDISTNAEDACRLAHPHMRYIVKRGRRAPSPSSAYAIYCQTRKTRVVLLIRVCDISSNAEDVCRIAHPRMRYILPRSRLYRIRGRRQAWLSLVHRTFFLQTRDNMHISFLHGSMSKTSK